MVALDFNATVFMQMFHFLLMLIVLRLVAYRPLMNIIEQRQAYIAGEIEQAESQKVQAAELKAEMDAGLQKARDEAKAIVDRAVKASEEQAQKILEEARADAQKVKEDALADIQREKEKAVAQLRNEVASLAVLVASKVVKDGLTIDEQHNLVQDAIKEVGQLPC
ncbi:MAG: F0F1 ATP synthase subunit B [Candidatus Desulforudis sp.]|nr:F0F1 ATP synthase subunit B [Desulforudis sp.]